MPTINVFERAVHTLSQSTTDSSSDDGREAPAAHRSSERQRREAPPPASHGNLEAGIEADALALRGLYLLDDVLAVGANYIVYKARDARVATPPVTQPIAVVKTLRPELRACTEALARLKREFSQTSALNHANIVRMFELAHASGHWFIAMELLEGRSLAALIYEWQPKRLATAEAFGILQSCAAALAAAHRRGICHGDFRPDNVWISTLKDVRVMGIGAAPMKNGGDTHIPAASPCTSTPSYASPQILAGESPEPRDDVFSFACVAYELLSGQHPFGRLNAAEMRMSHTALARPSGLSPQRWRALKRGMDWERAHRTADIQSLCAQLDDRFDRVAPRSSLRDTLHGLSRHAASRFASLAHRLTHMFPSQVAMSDLARSGIARMRGFNARCVGACATLTVSATARLAVLLGMTQKTVAPIRAAWIRAGQYRLSPIGARSLALLLHSRRAWTAGAAALALAVFVLFDLESDSSASSLEMTTVAAGTITQDLVEGPLRIEELLDRRTTTADRVSLAIWQRGALDIDAKFRRTTIFDPQPQIWLAQPTRKTAAPIDSPRSRITLELASADVSEAAVAAVLVLRRTGSTRNAALVRWRTVMGSARPGVDYQEVTSGVARFADNQSVRALYVPIAVNRFASGSRTFEVELSKPSAGVALGKIKRTVVTIHKLE